MKVPSVHVTSVVMVRTDKLFLQLAQNCKFYSFCFIDSLLVSCGYDLNVSLWRMQNYKLISSLKVYIYLCHSKYINSPHTFIVLDLYISYCRAILMSFYAKDTFNCHNRSVFLNLERFTLFSSGKCKKKHLKTFIHAMTGVWLLHVC